MYRFYCKPTDRTKKVGDKNGVICLVIKFTPKVIVTKMSKMDHFWYFLLMAAKIQSVWEKYLSVSESFYLAPLGNAMNYWVLSYQDFGFLDDSAVFRYFCPQYLTNGNSKAY